MALVVYNTLTRKKEEFIPLKEGEVRMYVCGITPYDKCHLGHGRCYVVFDAIRRYLEHKKYKVTHVQNFTDIDDKIIARAQALSKEPLSLAEENIKAYFGAMDKLNVKRAGEYPRVTEHMKEIINTVSRLIDRGYAYVVDGNVYFSIDKFVSYGKLSGRDKEEMLAGARVEVDKSKKDPLDFALWKKAKEGEIKWQSPWGEGRPGWHIECSVMSTKYLGETFDIHGGGQDLIFPHHENEIAQAESACGKPFAKYWLHNGFVTINKEKMSKSLGNFFMLDDIYKKYEPAVVRFFLLTKHYRSPVDFSDSALEETKRSLEGIEALNEKIKPTPSSPMTEKQKTLLEETEEKFEQAMDDDFNTAEAIGYVFRLVKELNIEITKAQPSISFLVNGKETINKLLSVLGIELKNISEVDMVLEAEELKKQRDEERKNRDFTKADELRKKLNELGYEVEDTPQGTFLKPKS